MILIMLGGIAAALAASALTGPHGLWVWAVAGGLFAAGALGVLWQGLRLARLRGQLRAAMALVEDDPAPCFCTDAGGEILFQNAAATRRFGPAVGQVLIRALGPVLPNAAAVILRQQRQLEEGAFARETIPVPRGRLRLTGHRMGQGRLWRLDDLEADGLPLGEGIGLPMMVVSASDTILSMNGALRAQLGRRATALDEVIEAEGPLIPGRRVRMIAEGGAVDSLPVVLPAQDGRREIYLVPEAHAPATAPVAARAFDHLPVALLHIGPDGRLLASNQPARQLLGIGAGPGGLLSTLVEGLGRPVNDWVMDTLAARIPDRSEVVRVRNRDQDVFVQITLSRITDAGGPSLLAVLHDATELKRLEQQFIQSQKMQAIGELAGGVAHDFNNLLTAIGGHCDLLMLRHDRGDPDYADLEQIHQNANRAAALVGQLLAFSRKQTLEPELFDLRDSMGELAHLLNRLVGEKITLRLVHDPALVPIRADRRQFDQVIMNLVVNARDAMPDGGEILVETRLLHLSEPLCRDRAEVPAGRYVTISVVDQGHGIPPDKLPRIFEPFFTTKRLGEGTGLGLSMAYGIVKQTGGYIFVDSEVGVGSRFTIYCPAHALPGGREVGVKGGGPPAAQGAQGAEAAPDRTGIPVILLVEDEAPVRAFAARALRLRGYVVIEAASGEEALEQLADPALEVDLFLTDIVMPGLDGPSWVRRALEARPGVRVIFISGYAEDQIENGSIGLPNSVFLGKPFSLMELTETVAREIG